jgi:hypothetical protein
VSEAEIRKLPDPDLLRDAIFLAQYGRWSPSELDAMDMRLLRLVKALQKPRKSSGS